MWVNLTPEQEKPTQCIICPQNENESNEKGSCHVSVTLTHVYPHIAWFNQEWNLFHPGLVWFHPDLLIFYPDLVWFHPDLIFYPDLVLFYSNRVLFYQDLKCNTILNKSDWNIEGLGYTGCLQCTIQVKCLLLSSMRGQVSWLMDCPAAVATAADQGHKITMPQRRHYNPSLVAAPYLLLTWSMFGIRCICYCTCFFEGD